MQAFLRSPVFAGCMLEFPRLTDQKKHFRSSR